jgi:hypothetical protein
MEVAMRIKIKGEITAERLAEALHAAAEKYEAVRPGHKVYGANLYLTAFDADGLPFDLVDHRGEPLSITIEAKSGELVKPALTAEGAYSHAWRSLNNIHADHVITSMPITQ